jgi:hypothetical protein
MPAGLPGSTSVQNAANPSLGLFVIFDLLSGPKGSPKDTDNTGNASTGALSTGIGFGSPPVIGLTAPASIVAAGFNDDYTPGVTKPDGTASANSTLMYIGGGRSDAPTIATFGAAIANPYTAGFGIGGAGQGGSRDAGAGPAFTGFTMKTVTAAGAVAIGAVVETGFSNRSGQALVTGQSVFGSSGTASAAVA